jgi:hypothetical protein
MMFRVIGQFRETMKGLLTNIVQANNMRITSQSMVGIVTIICLLAQGYIFTYILKVEPNALITMAPIILFVVYIYAKNRRIWWYYKPIYWMAAVVAITIADLAPYLLTSNIFR